MTDAEKRAKFREDARQVFHVVILGLVLFLVGIIALGWWIGRWWGLGIAATVGGLIFAAGLTPSASSTPCRRMAPDSSEEPPCMTADEFAKAWELAAKGGEFTDTEAPHYKAREAAIRAWAAIKRLWRTRQGDPVLGLIKRYDLTGVMNHQLVFRPGTEAGRFRHALVASQCMYDYYVQGGMMRSCNTRKMIRGRTGVTSARFPRPSGPEGTHDRRVSDGRRGRAARSDHAPSSKDARAITPLAARFNFLGRGACGLRGQQKRHALKPDNKN